MKIEYIRGKQRITHDSGAVAESSVQELEQALADDERMAASLLDNRTSLAQQIDLAKQSQTVRPGVL